MHQEFAETNYFERKERTIREARPIHHLGDITKISGYDVEPVDVITGGSPCQDLSVAGKRGGMSKACPACGYRAVGNSEETVCPECGAALAYTRSGLFMEQIRIIKEMRQNDRNHGRTGMLVRPRYCIWENVPGALSSNKGKDFQAVLTEFARVGEPGAPDVPMPETGKWPKAGCIYAEMGGWSIAYRIHDAQYHGVPQRRRRIAVLADFNGLTAAEILFDPQLRGEAEEPEPIQTFGDPGGKPGREIPTERESLPWDLEPGGAAREGADAGTESGTDCTISFQERAGRPGGAKGSSFSVNGQEPCPRSKTKTFSIQGNTIDRNAKQNGSGISEDVAHTLDSADRHGVMAAGFSFGQSEKARSVGYEQERSPTLRGGEGGNQKPVALVASGFDGGMGAKAGNIGYEEEQAITTKSCGGGVLPHPLWRSRKTNGMRCAT